MRPSWFKISALLASVWFVVGGLVWGMNAMRPSPEKLVAFAMAHRVAGRPASEHEAILAAVADQYHHLDMADRGALLTSGELKPWWQELSMPERLQFRAKLFPQILRIVDFFDTFSPEQRQINFQRLMGDVRKRGGDDIMSDIVGPNLIQTIKFVGLKPFIANPVLDQKFETLVFFYEMEKRIVWRGR